MSKGNYTGTASSATLAAKDNNRSQITIQHTNGTTVALGLEGEDAVAGEGIQLVRAGDSVVLVGEQARLKISVIGNGGTGTFQTGKVVFNAGPYAGA